MKISVAIITYNQERFVTQAIESVLGQRVGFDYEILIADDSSTDRTPEIIQEFHRRYSSRIVPILRTRNLGANRNLEAVMAACRGEYIALLEGDDYWTCEDKLQKQVDFLDAHPSYALCCHRAAVTNEMLHREEGVLPVSSAYPAGTYSLTDLFSGNFVMTASVVFRRNFLNGLPAWFGPMNFGDWPLCALIARAGKICLMDETMSVYRVHSAGVWTRRPTKNRLHECIRMLDLLDAELEFAHSAKIRRTIANYYRDLAVIAREENDRLETSRNVTKCIQNGGLTALTPRAFAGFLVYFLVGQRYQAFSRRPKAGHP